MQNTMSTMLIAAALAVALVLDAGCHSASMSEMHDPAEVHQTGSGSHEVLPSTTLTTTETPVIVSSATSYPSLRPGDPPIIETKYGPAGYILPDGTFMPLTVKQMTREDHPGSKDITPPTFDAKGSGTDRHISGSEVTTLRGSTAEDMVKATPALAVNDTVPSGSVSTGSAGESTSKGNGDATSKTEFAKGSGGGVLGWLGDAWSFVLTWFWIILLGIAVVNVVCVALYFIPATTPIAMTVWYFEAACVPVLGSVFTWFVAKTKLAEAAIKTDLATGTLSKIVPAVDAGATAGTVKAPVFQALSSTMNADEKALVDTLRPPNAVNIIEGGVVAPTAPAAVQPTPATTATSTTAPGATP